MRNTLHIRRTFWENIEEKAKADYVGPVDPPQCAWSLDDGREDAFGEQCKARHRCYAVAPYWPPSGSCQVVLVAVAVAQQ